MAYSHKSCWYTPSESRYERECADCVLKEMADLCDDPNNRIRMIYERDDPNNRKEPLERCEQTHLDLTHMSVADMLKPWYVP